MDLRGTDAEEDFRRTVRAWLRDHPPAAARPPADGQADDGSAEAEYIESCRRWQRELFQHGWAGISWPVEAGGAGGTVVQEAIFEQEQQLVGAPTGGMGVTLSMAGPTVITHGDDAQRKRYLAPMLRGDAIWCQLFSEPDSGSDLASLSTRAEPRDGGWVVNGQKVWSSAARHADLALLLARTSTGATKHEGITYFALDMRTPGVQVRPLRQMNGAAHFNEVFLTDVFVPADCVLGDVGDGWRVARTTLNGERKLIGSGGRMAMAVGDVIELARRMHRTEEPTIRVRLARAHAYEQVLRYMNLRVWTEASQGRPPSATGSLTKLLKSRHLAELSALALELLDAHALLADADAIDGGRWQSDFLSFPGMRIGGGTDEIQKTIVAERMLALPRERSQPR